MHRIFFHELRKTAMKSGTFRGKCAENKATEPTVLKFYVFLSPFSAGIRDLLEEEPGRFQEPVRMENSRKTLAARQTYHLTETMGRSTEPTEIQSRYATNIEGEH